MMKYKTKGIDKEKIEGHSYIQSDYNTVIHQACLLLFSSIILLSTQNLFFGIFKYI